ncbi:MAG: hypothetical protein IPK19_17630 [Chloroflexi bacterium]|nr:hypothetical protein [Chloroflexota bacterium]
MKRFSVLFLVILLTLGVMVLPAAAQDAPEGVWLGTWPYTAPGTHTLNSFATGGLDSNLGAPIYRHFVELPPAMYMFATSEYVPLLAESWGFVDGDTAYEYTLKEGALWSNGEPVTSQDVVDTFDVGRSWAGRSGPTSPAWKPSMSAPYASPSRRARPRSAMSARS